ncbi:MAG TPA: acyl-CoA dehydrogenase family protein [Aggregatilineales bacterium]|nr:acyl-CoA dehydrogenase family protein [Aggregatilineales bacterium]
MYVQDEKFGKIVDYDYIRKEIYRIYDHVYPDYNLLAATLAATEVASDDPNHNISIGASALAYSILVAAEEYEMAASLKGTILTLGWTEEHCGSDLLSIRTQAAPLSDDPEEKQYHVKGSKWLINCSYHADYHVVLAKLDPEQDGPRSLSFFLVPRSSCKNWERIETHVMTGMVLTRFEIDGPGTLVGKPGHGLSIVQRMAMPSKYQCTYMGLRMIREAIPAGIRHLSSKHIFGSNPIQFSNVFRQMYDLVLKCALYDFMFHRAIVFNTDGFLAFHGTLLKSFLLLRINEVLSKNWLVVGSKGFTRESIIGRDAIDSFVLPVFDGHYTINTLMSAKHAPRYLNGSVRVNLSDRLTLLRDELFVPTRHAEIQANSRELRKPPFFNLIDYMSQFDLPIDLDVNLAVSRMNELLDEINDRNLSNDPDHKYKVGDLIHWLESVVAACELWKLAGEDHYLNVIVIQYNGFVNTFNNVISEGDLSTEFLLPIRQIPPGDNIDDPEAFLLRLHNIESLLRENEAMPTT